MNMKELHLQPPEPVHSPEPQELIWEWDDFNLIENEMKDYHNPKEPRLGATFCYDGDDWDFVDDGIITVQDEDGEDQFITVGIHHPLLAPYRKRLDEHVQDYINDNTEDNS